MRLLATAIITDEYGRYLLILRPDNHQWALPSGSVEHGEVITTALIREVAEETTLQVVPIRLVKVNSISRGQALVFAFRAVSRGGTPAATAEALQAGFFDVAHLPQPLSPIHARLLQDGHTHHKVEAAWGVEVGSWRSWLARFRRWWAPAPPSLEPPPPEWSINTYFCAPNGGGEILWCFREGEWVLPGGAGSWLTAQPLAHTQTKTTLQLDELTAVYHPAANAQTLIFRAHCDSWPLATSNQLAYFGVGQEPTNANAAHVAYVAQAVAHAGPTRFGGR